MAQTKPLKDQILEKIKSLDVENTNLKGRIELVNEQLKAAHEKLNAMVRENAVLKKQLALVEIDEPTSPTLQSE